MRRPSTLTLTSAALVLLLLSACDSETFDTGLPPGGDGGSSSSDGYPWPGPQSDLGNPDPTPKKDLGACGKQSIPIKLVVKGDIPDLFLVVDRSGSMITPIDLFNWALGTKWTVMRKTLSSLVDYYSANIRFGLSLFPSDNACAAGKIDIPLKMGNANPIKTKLQQTNPNGSTPTHTTLDAVRVYLSNVPPAKGGRFVLLATDGVPNCGAQADTDTSKETLAAVQKLAASGAKVVVLGFGSVVAGNPGLLNQLAAAGGAPNKTGPQKFYPAANETQLKQALFTIAGGIIPPPCTYKLNKPPPDPEKVTVTFDGVPVPRSKSSKTGWNYTGGGTEITFFGSYCDKLRTGGVKEVKFFFGCKGPVIE
jgi:von Willebrand factor type A domain